MSNEYKRLLSARTLTGTTIQPEAEAWDGGGHCTLEVQCDIFSPGATGGFIALQHSATNEVGSFRDLPNVNWALDTAGGHLTVSHFLRYIRFVTTGTINGGPVVQLDIIGKSCG